MSKTNKKGFTLIEVVLVIAIGALIFLLAFIAFRNAQVNRRDSQRRSDLDKIAAEVANFSADHNGSVPAGIGTSASNNTFLYKYINALKDPSGSNPVYADIAAATPTPVGKLTWTPGGSGVTGCKTGTTLSNTSDWRVEMQLEKGVACRDSLNQ